MIYPLTTEEEVCDHKNETRELFFFALRNMRTIDHTKVAPPSPSPSQRLVKARGEIGMYFFDRPRRLTEEKKDSVIVAGYGHGYK